MSDFLFERRARAIIAAPFEDDFGRVNNDQLLTVEGFRMQFKIERDLDKAPNKAQVKITNLAESTRAGLQDKGGKLIFFAGYESTLAQVFIGDIRAINHIDEGTDFVTTIDAGDGDRAFANAHMSTSFAGATKLIQIIRKACDVMKLDTSGLDQVLKGVPGTFENGFTAHGRVNGILDKVLPRGYTWSVQDGRMQILAPDGSNFERIVVLSPESGLIGTPIHVSPLHRTSTKKSATTEAGKPRAKGKKPFIKFKCLLSPDIVPGGRVELQSQNIHGIYRVHKVRHDGDTDGHNWYTEGECEIA